MGGDAIGTSSNGKSSVRYPVSTRRRSGAQYGPTTRSVEVLEHGVHRTVAHPLHPQLQAVANGLLAAQARLHRLAESTPPGSWPARADPDRWSAGECVAHLNLTAIAFLPLIRTALAEAVAIGGGAPARFRRDPRAGCSGVRPPPVRFRVRTAAQFTTGSEPLSQLLAAFDRLQQEQLDVVAPADGRPIHMVKITSPFNSRLRYNLYACLTILPPHQERHIWQAEQVLLERFANGR